MKTITFFVIAALGNATQNKDCDDPQTQFEMNQCAGMKRVDADKRLNELYSRYRERLGAAQKKKLTEAQRAWLAFRDSWCIFVASGVEGGSAQPLVMSECLTEVTAHRIKQLEEVSSCKEGDLSCPSP